MIYRFSILAPHLGHFALLKTENIILIGFECLENILPHELHLYIKGGLKGIIIKSLY